MATSKKNARKSIVAFALKDFSDGEGEDAFTLTEGQRVELPKDVFEAMKGKGIVAEGVFVKMKTSVEGGRYSLKPHDTTWLHPRVYEAWKAAGYCEPTKDDPEVAAVLKAREEAARQAVAERDEAKVRSDELEAKLNEAGLQLQAARVQAVELGKKVAALVGSGSDLDQVAGDLQADIEVLIDLFPDLIEVPEASQSTNTE